MSKLKKIYVLLSVVFFIVIQSNHVQADSFNERNCDCTEIIGKCSGAITDIREEKVASQQSTSVLFNVRSNHQQCSKVEYYIDNTPYQSIFFGGSTSESTFGLKKKVKIEYSACNICKMKTDKNKKISDEDIDALMDKAQKEGDQRINQANYNARVEIEQSNRNYNSTNESLTSIRNSIQQSSQNITNYQKNYGGTGAYQKNNVSNCVSGPVSCSGGVCTRRFCGVK